MTNKPTKVRAVKTRTPAQYSGLLADLIAHLQSFNPAGIDKQIKQVEKDLEAATECSDEDMLDYSVEIQKLTMQRDLYYILRNNGLVE